MMNVLITAGVSCPSSIVVFAPHGVIAILITVVLATSDSLAVQAPTSGQEPGLILSTVTVGSHIPAAIAAAEQECDRLGKEWNAFERFESRIASIAVPTINADGGVPTPLKQMTNTRTELSEIREAYRSTIMEIDHYESEYGESLVENMCLELNEDIATAIVDGQQFSYPLKQMLLHQSAIARARRESLLRTIESEQASLCRSQSRVGEIEPILGTDQNLSSRSVSKLYTDDHHLHHCMERSERLLRNRQHHIHSDGVIQEQSKKIFIQVFLYEPLEVDFPVLMTVTELYQRLQNRRRAVIREISSRS